MHTFVLTLRQFASLIYVTPELARKILLDEKTSLSDTWNIVRVVRKYRKKRIVHPITKKVTYIKQYIDLSSARALVDNILFKDFKRKNPLCRECSAKTHLHVHHINHNHYDNRKNNVIRICRRCHYITHQECRRVNNNTDPLLTENMALQYAGIHKAELYRRILEKKVKIYYSLNKTKYFSLKELNG